MIAYVVGQCSGAISGGSLWQGNLVFLFDVVAWCML